MTDRTDKPFGDDVQQTGHPVFGHANEDASSNRVERCVAAVNRDGLADQCRNRAVGKRGGGPVCRVHNRPMVQWIANPERYIADAIPNSATWEGYPESGPNALGHTKGCKCDGCYQLTHATSNRVDDYPEDLRWRQHIEDEIVCLQEAVADLQRRMAT